MCRRERHSIAEGISYVAKDVPLCSLMFLATIMNFCVSGPVGVGLAYYAKTRLGSPAAYGTLISSLAAGSLMGAVLAGLWKIRKRGILILLGAVVLGFCLSSIGLAERTWSVAAILVVMGAAAGVLNVHISAWAMQRIDTAVRGRVSSVLMLAAFGMIPISLGVAGFLVAWNLKVMFLLAGALMLIAAAGAAFQKPVRQIE